MHELVQRGSVQSSSVFFSLPHEANTTVVAYLVGDNGAGRRAAAYVSMRLTAVRFWVVGSGNL
jgi:ABC-type cobalamin transport system ATPase subunit